MISFIQINKMILFLLFCSTFLLLYAFYSQYVLNMTPCKLCIWQRVPHAIIVFLSVLMVTKKRYQNLGCITCCATILLSVLISGYHTGIEYKLWPGLESCSGSSINLTLDPDLFLETLLNTPIVRCDEPTWTMFNISMAGWNFFISSILSILWITVSFLTFKQSKA